jgi:hypothetical protein
LRVTTPPCAAFIQSPKPVGGPKFTLSPAYAKCIADKPFTSAFRHPPFLPALSHDLVLSSIVFCNFSSNTELHQIEASQAK